VIIKILLIIIALILVEIYYETNFPKLAVVNIKTKKLKRKGSIRVLQISDYHNFKYESRVISLVEEVQPDLIVLTGDLIDKSTKDYSKVYNFLNRLVSLNSNIYFVPGNHELKSGNMDSILKDVAKREVKVLINSSDTISLGGEILNICGIDYSSSKRGDLNKTLRNTEKDTYTILLCHKPDIVKKHNNIPCDLILCGHTHGGQIRIPIMGAAIAPGQGLLPKYNKGLYKTSNTMLYIDSGVGTTRIPVRFINRSQISLINIVKE
jgi:uncharacterized protein